MPQNLKVYESNSENRKVYLSKIGLVSGTDGSGFALDVTYIIETPERVEELHIPRVALPIHEDVVHIFEETDYELGLHRTWKANIGFGAMNVDRVNGVAYTIKTIKEKTKEMTLEEIEKKLGHKVKIISKEDTK